MTDHIRSRLTLAVADRYTVERELGGGGMSRVFVALEHALGRRVVIKTLPEDATLGTSAAERFRREILTAARIEHANIVPVLAAGDIAGTPYFVMPWVDGDSLRQLLQRERVPLPQAISILRDVARALAAAHAQGVVHRDIKPENILLSGGAARVTDFGVAKALSVATQSPATNAGMTGLGISIGTPAYMAPEQLAADPALDHRADIYAWGLVAYELLSGHYPFEGLSGAALLQAQLGTNPPALAQRDPSIPAGVSGLVVRTLLKDPANRPQSATELIAALDDAHSSSTRAGVGEQKRPTSRTIGLLVGAVAVVVVAGVGIWRALKPAPTTDEGVIAVAPFHVSGSEQLRYLREGIADLMVPQLASIAKVKPSSARQMFASWKRVAGSMDTDLDDDGMLKAASAIGAGQVIVGSIVSTGPNILINAQLRRVRGNSVVHSDTVMGVVDSVVAMTARLTAKLLLVSDGASAARLTEVMRAKPAAITAFLNGERNYRSGRYNDALKQFAESYAADSTFPLVPLRIHTVNGWMLSDAIAGPWVQRALAHRAQLTGSDSLLLEAYADPALPRGTPPVANMQRVWDIALRANSAEVWYVAADQYFHNGYSVGVTDAMDKALDGFKRAEAIDSTYVGGIEHQTMLYLTRGDTANARAAERRQARIDSTGDYFIVSNTHLRMSVANPSELAALAHEIAVKPPRVAATVGGFLYSLSTVFTVPPAMTIVDSVLANPNIASSLSVGSAEYGLLRDALYNTGRVAEAQQFVARDTSRIAVAEVVLASLYWDGDTAAARRGAARIGQQSKSGRDTTGTVSSTLPRLALALALWSLDQGDSVTSRKVLEELRAYRAPATDVSLGYPTQIYSRLLETRMAVKARAPNAKALLAGLDSAIVATPRLDRRDVRSIANLMVAGMWAEVGEPNNAYIASRRRDVQVATPVFATTFLRLRADAAEKIGKKDEAISALQAYVELRRKADAPLQADVQAARARLKALEKKS